MDKKTVVALMMLAGAGYAAAQACGIDSWDDPGSWAFCIMTGFLGWLLANVLTLFVGFLKWAILLNPDPASVNPLVNAYIGLLQPLFILLITVLGFYLVFMSGSPGGRAQAKSLFLKLFLSMILISLSPAIFGLMLDMSEALTEKFLASTEGSEIQIDFLETSIAYILISFFAIPVLFLIGVSIGLRWIFVLIFAALFPLTIFLYFFELPYIGPIGKEMGMKLWRWTVGAIFSQVAQGLMFAITVLSFGNISDAAGFGKIGAALIGLAGFVGIAIVPLLVMNVLEWVGSAFMTGGMMLSFTNPALGAAMTAAGGMMMGQGPGSSLMAAGGVASMTRASQESQKRAKMNQEARKKQ